MKQMKDCDNKAIKLALLEELLDSLDGNTVEKIKGRKKPMVEVTEVKSEAMPIESLPEEIKDVVSSMPKKATPSMFDEEDEVDEDKVDWESEDKEDIIKRLFD